MREIKFRGKDEDTGEWIYGGIVHQTDFYGDTCDKWFIITGNETNDYDIGYPYLVEEKSIGQFTGLKDKNGKEIYDGDIVKLDDDVKKTFNLQDGVIKYVGGCLLVSGNNGNLLSTLLCLVDVYYSLRGEIIGNIYENPELLGE